MILESQLWFRLRFKTMLKKQKITYNLNKPQIFQCHKIQAAIQGGQGKDFLFRKRRHTIQTKTGKLGKPSQPKS